LSAAEAKKVLPVPPEAIKQVASSLTLTDMTQHMRTGAVTQIVLPPHEDPERAAEATDAALGAMVKRGGLVIVQKKDGEDQEVAVLGTPEQQMDQLKAAYAAGSTIRSRKRETMRQHCSSMLDIAQAAGGAVHTRRGNEPPLVHSVAAKEAELQMLITHAHGDDAPQAMAASHRLAEHGNALRRELRNTGAVQGFVDASTMYFGLKAVAAETVREGAPDPASAAWENGERAELTVADAAHQAREHQVLASRLNDPEMSQWLPFAREQVIELTGESQTKGESQAAVRPPASIQDDAVGDVAASPTAAMDASSVTITGADAAWPMGEKLKAEQDAYCANVIARDKEEQAAWDAELATLNNEAVASHLPVSAAKAAPMPQDAASQFYNVGESPLLPQDRYHEFVADATGNVITGSTTDPQHMM
jgi:hypothetical protein